MHTLTSIGDLIGHGFTDIQKTWKPTLKYSMWFFLAPILFGVVVFLAVSAGFMSMEEGSTLPAVGGLGFGLFMILAYIGLIIAMLYASTGLIKYMLAHAQGHAMTSWQPKQSILSYIPGVLWVSILVCVPLIASWILVVLPGAVLQNNSTAAGLMTALFIVAVMVFNVWFGILLSQSSMIVLDDGARGIAALKESYAMVVGRWWKTLWRMVLPNLLFQMCVSTAITVLYMIAFAIGAALFGGWSAATGMGGDAEAVRASNVGFGLVGVVLMVVFGLVMIAFTLTAFVAQMIFQSSVTSRLFLSLKQTQSK